MTISLVGVIIVVLFLIIHISNKNKTRKIRKIVNKNFKTSIIKPAKTVDAKELKEKLGLFDLDIYNNLFEGNIRRRGQRYHANNTVQHFKSYTKGCSATVYGTRRYDVSINFENDEIVNTRCNCPYFIDERKNCKHIYALLIKAKAEKNLQILKEIILDYSDRFNKMIDEEFAFVKKNLKLNENALAELESNLQHLIVMTKNTDRNVKTNELNESYLFRLLTYLIQYSYRFSQELEKEIVKMDKKHKKEIRKKLYNDNEKSEFKEALLDYMILKEQEKKENGYDKELEEEMDRYVLADWQKEMVRKEGYEPWNFDADDEEEMAQWSKYDKMD